MYTRRSFIVFTIAAVMLAGCGSDDAATSAGTSKDTSGHKTADTLSGTVGRKADSAAGLITKPAAQSGAAVGGDKFVGTWIATERDRTGSNPIFIEKQEEGRYIFRAKKKPGNRMTFNYDPKKDRLRGSFDGMTVIITYKDQDHIVVVPEQRGAYDEPMELKRAKN